MPVKRGQSESSDVAAQPALQTRDRVVAAPAEVRALLWIGFPLLGAGAGRLLLSVAAWMASLPWVPFQGPARLLASIPPQLATTGTLLLGATAGLVFAYLAAKESLTVVVSDDRVALARNGFSQSIKRELVDGVFLDGKQLVLLGPAAVELARETDGLDLGAQRLSEAFLAHGYPWLTDGDPHKDEFRRWVEDLPDLPPGANALLKARARALDKNDDDDGRQLRTELAKLGIVVRNEKKRQFWRRSGQVSNGSGESGAS
jgi:hypothetical protein